MTKKTTQVHVTHSTFVIEQHHLDFLLRLAVWVLFFFLMLLLIGSESTFEILKTLLEVVKNLPLHKGMSQKNLWGGLEFFCICGCRIFATRVWGTDV